MKAFFKKELENLAVAGIRQMEFLTAEQTTELIAQLCVISEKKFGYIPTEVQKTEIRKQIIEDVEFNGINTRWLFKVLSRIATKYWNARSTMTEEELTPAPPEVAEKYLAELHEAISNVTSKYTHGTGSGTRIREALDKLAPKPETPIELQPATMTEAMSLLRQQWILETKPDPSLAGTKEANDSFLLWMDENVERLSNQ